MPKKSKQQPQASTPGRNTPPQKNPHATRETVESIVVAVILAFLFRAFIAEAFVIPTGSMAPTLYGRNKDVVCFQCGYDYATGASSEVARSADEQHYYAQFGAGQRPQISRTYCPICRAGMEINPEENGNHVSFSGDRILVSKFAYALGEPSRWDVIVFKFPGNAKLNYIKRLIGLPDEAILIRHGNIHTANLLFRTDRDIFSQPINQVLLEVFAEHGIKLSDEAHVTHLPGSTSVGILIEDGDRTYALTHNLNTSKVSVYGDHFQIQRKPPRKLKAMLQIVDDTDFRGEALSVVDWPSRWQDWTGEGDWDVDVDASVFETKGKAGKVAWLTYRHLVPSDEDWRAIMDGVAPQGVAERPGQLISDYYAYNDFYRSFNQHGNRNDSPKHWVGDLAVECDVDIQGSSGRLLLDLVEGGAHYRCSIDVATGEATLSIINGEAGFSQDGDEKVAATVSGATSIKGAGSHSIQFANVDDQLTLWVDGSVVSFGGPTTYESRPDVTPQWSETDPGDAEPAGIGSDGLAVEVSHVRIYRDIYYVATDAGSEYNRVRAYSAAETRRIHRTPSEWSTTQLFASRGSALYGLEEDDFFPLGDNSPESKDARSWDNGERYVNRQLLIGKAVLIYWPHPWQSPIPFFPNFQRMRLIR